MAHNDHSDSEKEVVSVSISQLLLACLGITMPLIGYFATSAIADLKGHVQTISERERDLELKYSAIGGGLKSTDERIRVLNDMLSEKNSRFSTFEARLSAQAERIAYVESNLIKDSHEIRNKSQ